MNGPIVVSGTECVGALVLAGFRRVGSTPGPTALVREDQAVLVPDVPSLDENSLAAILDAAGLTPGELFALVDLHNRAALRAAVLASDGRVTA